MGIRGANIVSLVSAVMPLQAICLIAVLVLSWCAQVATKELTHRLPSFSNDGSELVMAAVLEASHDLASMHITMFMLGHKSLFSRPQMPFLMMNTSSEYHADWQRAKKLWEKTQYRKDDKASYFCRIRNHLPQGGSSGHNPHSQYNDQYITEAHWVPSQTTSDGTFNRMIDILRCEVKHVDAVYRHRPWEFVHENGLHVDIIRHDPQTHDPGLSVSPDSGYVLSSFSIPWKYRRIGFGMSLSKRNTRWDIWNHRHHRHHKQKGPVVYAALSGIRPLEPNRMEPGLPALLENVEHHLNLGIDHIFVSIECSKHSIHFQRYRIALEQYIRSGKLSLSSVSYGDVDDAVGFLGAVFIDDFTKWLHQLQALYLSKGIADYIVILQGNEFVSLTPKVTSIQQLLISSSKSIPIDELHESVERESRGYKPSFANRRLMLTQRPPESPNSNAERIESVDFHVARHLKSDATTYMAEGPPCYLVVETLGVADPPGMQNSFGPGDEHWMSSFFKQSVPVGPLPAYPILIAPTRNVWTLGWRVAGACSAHLWEWGMSASPGASGGSKPMKGHKRAHLSPPSSPLVSSPLGASFSSHRHEHLSRQLAGTISVNIAVQPWEDKPVTHVTHAYTFSPKVALAYLYKGHLEPWQISREKHPVNHHITQYANDTLARLGDRGFSLRGGLLRQIVTKAFIYASFPYFGHTVPSEKEFEKMGVFYDIISAEDAKKGPSKVPYYLDMLHKVTLSCTRSNTRSVNLMHLDIDMLKLSPTRGPILHLPTGQQDLRKLGMTECQDKCKKFADLI